MKLRKKSRENRRLNGKHTVTDNTDREWAERRRQLQREYHPEIDFPADYRQMRKLLDRIPGAKSIDEEDLRECLGEIIYAYKNRLKIPNHLLEVERSEEDLKRVSKLLRQIVETLLGLDARHIEDVVSVLQRVALVDRRPLHWNTLLADLKETSERTEALAVALKIVAIAEGRRKGRSRPKLPYFQPTRELMNLWQVLTGRQAVSPKGSAGKDGAAIQASTEFVRLGLRMVDGKVTTSNAITSIRNVLAMEKTIFALRSECGEDFERVMNAVVQVFVSRLP